MGNEDDEGWKTIRGKMYQCCGTDGCPGMCPKFVIVAGSRPGGTKPKCRTCGATYKLNNSERGSGKPKAQAKPNPSTGVHPGRHPKDSQKELLDKDKKIKQLEAQLAKERASKAEVETDESMDIEAPMTAPA